MKALTAYMHGAKTALHSIKLTLLIYLAYLAVALLLAIPFYGLFQAATSNSELPEGLMKGFDATIIREMLVSGGQLFMVFLHGFWPWVIAFGLVQVYLTGGIYGKISQQAGSGTVTNFHQYAIRFFWRYLKLVIYFLIIHLLLCLILYLPLLLFFAASSDLTDKQFVTPFLILLSFHVVILNFIFIWSDLVKSAIFEQDSRKVFKGIFRYLKLAFRKFYSAYFLGILLALAPAILIGAFYLIRQAIVVDTTGLILMIFLMQQLFMILRVFLRIWRLSSVYRFYLSAINPIFGS